MTEEQRRMLLYPIVNTASVSTAQKRSEYAYYNETEANSDPSLIRQYFIHICQPSSKAE